MKNEENIEENNKLDENDSNVKEEEEMAKKRRKGFVSDRQRKRVMAELKSRKARSPRRSYRRDYSDFKLSITYPKNHNIKMPTSSPTFSIKKLDKALDDIFKKKKKR